MLFLFVLLILLVLLAVSVVGSASGGARVKAHLTWWMGTERIASWNTRVSRGG